MGLPWRKIFGVVKVGASFAAQIGIPFAAQLVQGIHVAEAIPGLKGDQKKAAAKAIAEQLVGDDGLLSKDEALEKRTDEFVDAYVALVNRLAELKS